MHNISVVFFFSQSLGNYRCNENNQLCCQPADYICLSTGNFIIFQWPNPLFNCVVIVLQWVIWIGSVCYQCGHVSSDLLDWSLWSKQDSTIVNTLISLNSHFLVLHSYFYPTYKQKTGWPFLFFLNTVGKSWLILVLICLDTFTVFILSALYMEETSSLFVNVSWYTVFPFIPTDIIAIRIYVKYMKIRKIHVNM